MNIVAIIPARGGSKRLSRKNIHKIWGHPLLAWSIKACKESKLITSVWVSTEDTEIKDVALEYGARVHNRDPRLARDHVYKMEAIRSAVTFIDNTYRPPEIVVSLQANSPEITAETLDAALKTFIENDRNELMSVGPNLMQNAAFRIMKNWYVFQKDLSTKSGVFVCDVHDVHTVEDIKFIEKRTTRDFISR